MTRARTRLRFWVVTAATLAGIWATASLGFWQLSRAAEKAALQATIDARRQLPALEVAVFIAAPADPGVQYRTVHLRGTWLGRHTVFLDNRQMHGLQGFFVVTPLRLENTGQVVVVQRGWVQRSFVDRAEVPAVQTPTGTVEVTGRIAPPPAKLYEFAEPGSGMIRQNLDLAGYAREIGAPLAPVSVLQSGVAPDGMARDWPAVNTGIDKHYGYAFQWFALAGLIALLYGWFQIVRRFIPRS